jgi:hypothetical protein
LKVKLLISLFFGCLTALAQERHELNQNNKPKYFRNEEMIYNGKRYRVHNNYVTFGPGYLQSSIRNVSQKMIGIDLHFHIRTQHFQTGVMMSGETFGSNNNVQAHIAYGYRRETKTLNLAAYMGPSYLTGVVPYNDPVYGIVPEFYTNYGIYTCIQGVTKFAFDFGIGVELFAEYSKKQTMFGFKLIAYFSGAYTGPKRNYNPNVRAENPR